MRISDWSSDVCSADLRPLEATEVGVEGRRPPVGAQDAATLPCPYRPRHQLIRDRTMLQAVRCARLTVAQGPLEQQGSGDLEGGQPIRRGGRPFDRSPRRPRKRLYRDGGDPWIAGLVGSLQGAQGDPERDRKRTRLNS